MQWTLFFYNDNCNVFIPVRLLCFLGYETGKGTLLFVIIVAVI